MYCWLSNLYSEPASSDTFYSRATFMLRVYQEVELLELLRQFVESEADEVLPGLLGVAAVMVAKLIEVAHDDGVRTLHVRHGVCVRFSPIERRDLAALASLILVQVGPERLLFDEDLSIRNDNADVASVDGVPPEADGGGDILHPDDVLEELQPEALRVFFLVAAVLPLRCEVRGGAFLPHGRLSDSRKVTKRRDGGWGRADLASGVKWGGPTHKLTIRVRAASGLRVIPRPSKAAGTSTPSQPACPRQHHHSESRTPHSASPDPLVRRGMHRRHAQERESAEPVPAA